MSFCVTASRRTLSVPTFFSRRDGERTTGRAANLADRYPHLSDALGGYDTTLGE